MLSFALLAKDLYNIQKEVFGRLLETVRHGLESLEFDIYQVWMKTLKETLLGIIVPGKIVPSPLSDKFRPRLFLSPAFQFDTGGILDLFNQIYNALRGSFIEELVITRVFNELLKLVGAMAFNDLLQRTRLPRVLADGYYQNIRRIEEWCKGHNLPGSIHQLGHLMVHMFSCHL